jgi:hypothetical protein
VLLIKYSLGMSSDDCGGLSEYSHFFSTMRRVHLALLHALIAL